MNLLKQILLEYALGLEEDSEAAQQARDQGLENIHAMWWSPTGESPATHSTEGGQLRKLDKPKEVGKDKEPPKQERPPKQQDEPEPEPEQEVPENPFDPDLGLDLDDQYDDAKTKMAVIQKGHVPGEWWTAPGNEGSHFHEVVSGMVASALHEYPQLAEDPDELAVKVCQAYSDTTIGQNLGLRITKRGGASKKCKIVANAGLSKYRLVAEGIDTLVDDGKLSMPVKMRNYFGAKESIQKQKALVEDCASNGGTFYTSKGVEVSTEDLVYYIENSGGGANPSDTATLVTDDGCNGMVMFHSDKMATSDIQANSSPAAEFELYVEILNDLPEEQRSQARKIILDSATDLYETEQRLKRAGTEAAQIMSELSPEKMTQVLSNIKADAGLEQTRWNVSGYLNTAIGNKKPRWEIAPYLDCEGEDCSEEERLRAFFKYMSDERELCEDFDYPTKDQKTEWANNNGAFDCKPPPTRDHNKFLNRAAKQEYYIGGKENKSLNISGNIGEIREQAREILIEQHAQLNEMTIDFPDGSSKQLGDYIEARNVISKFHLDVIDGDGMGQYPGIFNLNMGGVVVASDELRSCLQVDNTDELIERFEVGVGDESEDIVSDDEGNVTSRNVFIYAIVGEERVEIAKKNFRAKTGQTGKWQTSYYWSKDIRNCFESKSEERFNPEVTEESEDPLEQEAKDLIRKLAVRELEKYHGG